MRARAATKWDRPMAASLKPAVAALAFALFCVGGSMAELAPIKIATSERVYADIAKQIGGQAVQAEFETVAGDAATSIVIATDAGEARAVAAKLGRAPPPRVVLTGDRFAPKKPDAYVWFHIGAMEGLAKALTASLTKLRPTQAGMFAANLQTFERKLIPVQAEMHELADYYRGTKVFATSFLFADMLSDLKFPIREPELVAALAHKGAAHDKASQKLTETMTQSALGVLVYDAETNDQTSKAFKNLALDGGVPVVGIRHTMPSGLDYQSWMLRQLLTLHGALNEAAQ